MAQKRSRRRFRVWMVIPIVLGLYMVYLFASNFAELADIHGKQETAQQRLDAIEDYNASLNEQIAYTGSKVFVERKARELLGWVYPEEYYLVGGK